MTLVPITANNTFLDQMNLLDQAVTVLNTVSPDGSNVNVSIVTAGNVFLGNAAVIAGVNVIPTLIVAAADANAALIDANAAFLIANTAISNVNYVNVSTTAAFAVANGAVTNTNYINVATQAVFAIANGTVINTAAAFAEANVAIANVNYVNTAVQAAFAAANTGASNYPNVAAQAAFAQVNIATANINYVNTATQAAFAQINITTANVNYVNTTVSAAFNAANTAGGLDTQVTNGLVLSTGKVYMLNTQNTLVTTGSLPATLSIGQALDIEETGGYAEINPFLLLNNGHYIRGVSDNVLIGISYSRTRFIALDSGNAGAGCNLAVNIF